MAKWGEGDPRWIVEERPDATNVNNWHWTEKNATPWSKERLSQLFENFLVEQDEISCSVDKVDKCDGEATVNNRKGKLIFFYEWELVLDWTGSLQKGSKDKHEGKITIPNLSEENSLDDIEITITIEKSTDESEALKAFMYNHGRDLIRKQLGVYVKELKEEYSKNLILPKKGEESATVAVPQNKETVVKTNSNALNKKERTSSTNTPPQQQNSVGCKLEVQTLEETVKFHCDPNALFNALTKIELITAFTRSPAKVDATRGGEFSLYDGNISGKFEELVPEKRIVQSWRLKSWPSGYYSHVLIELNETSSGTELTLIQSGIPAAEYDTMSSNWHRYYWNSIRQILNGILPLR